MGGKKAGQQPGKPEVPNARALKVSGSAA
jgi:hypothetical protein